MVEKTYYENIKTGSIYKVVDLALDATNERDGEDAVVYKDLKGNTFIREESEFIQKFKKVESHYDLVEVWAHAFNLEINYGPLKFPEDAQLDLAVELVKEEFKELVDAVEARDMKEIIDASVDLTWVIYRLQQVFGIDSNAAMCAVFESNMSKVSLTLQEAQKTRDSYAQKGIETITKEVGGMYFTHRKSDDKLLKSIRFKEPVFTQLDELCSES